MCRDRVTRGGRMQLLRVTALAVACVLAPPPPASAQISPSAAWSCEFANSATDCGFYLQAAASNRAAVVGPGRDGSTAIELTTHLGDIDISGSDSNERADLALSPSSRYCNQGQDEWWAHSLMFPPGYVPPPVAAVWNWGALFDFHNSAAGGDSPTSWSTPRPRASSSIWRAAQTPSTGRPILATTASRSARSPRTSGTTSCIT